MPSCCPEKTCHLALRPLATVAPYHELTQSHAAETGLKSVMNGHQIGNETNFSKLETNMEIVVLLMEYDNYIYKP